MSDKKSAGRAPRPKHVGFCHLDGCLQPLDPEKIAKHPELRFCCREHAVLYRQARGDYQRIGALGNEAQARVKAETGRIPKYEKRSQAVAESNRANPRRKKAVK
jgi:hypothetical protein